MLRVTQRFSVGQSLFSQTPILLAKASKAKPAKASKAAKAAPKVVVPNSPAKVPKVSPQANANVEKELKEVRSLLATVKSELALLRGQQTKNQKDLTSKLQSFTMDNIFAKYPLPMKALWDVLNDDKITSPDMALSIIRDDRCGISRKSKSIDGKMIGRSGTSVKGGATPLILAALAQRPDVVEALIADGANVNAKSTNKRTALHHAASNGDARSLTAILAADEKTLLAADKLGKTALHLAATNGNAEAVKVLLEKNTALDVTDSYGFTPIHYAATNGRPEVVELLAVKGANISAKTSKDRTVLDLFNTSTNTSLLDSATIDKIKALLTVSSTNTTPTPVATPSTSATPPLSTPAAPTTAAPAATPVLPAP